MKYNFNRGNRLLVIFVKAILIDLFLTKYKFG